MGLLLLLVLLLVVKVGAGVEDVVDWFFTTDGGPLYSWNFIILAFEVAFGLSFFERGFPLLE